MMPTTRGPPTASCRTSSCASATAQPLEESGHLRRPNGEYYLKGVAELAALPPASGALGGRGAGVG